MANELSSVVADKALDSGSYTRGNCVVGKIAFPAVVTYDGALLFENVLIPKNSSIDMAEIIYDYSSVGTNSGSWKFIVYGIDEDNTSDFSSSPFGRSKTTASLTVDEGPPTSGGVKNLNVKSILEEITSRGGWSSGNNVGFILDENNSSDDVYAFASDDTYLVYRLSAEPNFFPTPGTVSAPTFPGSSDYGFKISREGVDVGTASEEDLLFSTRKKVFKVLNEGTVDVSSGTASYAHNLGYNPVSLGYIKGTASGETRMYKLNKINDPYNSPDSGGYIVSGTTTTKIISFGGTTVPYGYLYTFIDPLN